MKTNNYVILNGKVIDESASLDDLNTLMSRFNARLVKSYTFKMKQGLRRVIRIESIGSSYIVYGPKNYIDSNAYSTTPLLVTFNKDAAYDKARHHNGTVSEFPAKEINFSEKHIQTLMLKF